MIQGIPDVDEAVRGTGRDRPAQRYRWRRFFAFGALAIVVAVAAETHDFVVRVVTHRHHKGAGIGNIEAAEAINVETGPRAGAGADGVPATDGQATTAL